MQRVGDAVGDNVACGDGNSSGKHFEEGIGEALVEGWEDASVKSQHIFI